MLKYCKKTTTPDQLKTTSGRTVQTPEHSSHTNTRFQIEQFFNCWMNKKYLYEYFHFLLHSGGKSFYCATFAGLVRVDLQHQVL